MRFITALLGGLAATFASNLPKQKVLEPTPSCQDDCANFVKTNLDTSGQPALKACENFLATTITPAISTVVATTITHTMLAEDSSDTFDRVHEPSVAVAVFPTAVPYIALSNCKGQDAMSNNTKNASNYRSACIFAGVMASTSTETTQTTTMTLAIPTSKVEFQMMGLELNIAQPPVRYTYVHAHSNGTLILTQSPESASLFRIGKNQQLISGKRSIWVGKSDQDMTKTSQPREIKLLEDSSLETYGMEKLKFAFQTTQEPTSAYYQLCLSHDGAECISQTFANCGGKVCIAPRDFGGVFNSKSGEYSLVATILPMQKFIEQSSDLHLSDPFQRLLSEVTKSKEKFSKFCEALLWAKGSRGKELKQKFMACIKAAAHLFMEDPNQVEL